MASIVFKNSFVKCKGKDLPAFFEIDIKDLDIDDTILVRDIKAPKGIKIIDADRVAVAGVVKAR